MLRKLNKRKPILPITIISLASASLLYSLTGCSATDKYHNKRHLDVMKKDVDAIHKDIDRILGIDEPSTLVDE